MAKHVIDKEPAYLWYPKDYETDEVVKFLTYEQQGIYRRLLDHQFLNGSIPKAVPEIGLLLGFRNGDLDRFVADVWPLLGRKFHEDAVNPGRLVNRRMERVRRKRLKYLRDSVKLGRAGALKRWGKGRKK